MKEQLNELNKEINPHLLQCHNKIYKKYVRDWFWLRSDYRNWNWWWWAENPWWNEPCKTCNDLWHKYEKKIDLFEHKRINLIKTINEKFCEYMLRDLFVSEF